MKASLFVATHDLPRHLQFVCAALTRQKNIRDFEILFCEDGQNLLNKDIIENFKKNSPFETNHFTQPHHGFRKCKILNRALSEARGDLCIFLDGDFVPHPEFVKDHVDNWRPGFYSAGRRIEVGESLSNQLTLEDVEKGFFDGFTLRLARDVFRGESEYLQRSVHISNTLLRNLLGLNHVVDLKGCNYSVSRKTLIDLNGFDESYEGYGREDTDLEIRMLNHGLKINSLKGLAVQYHLWHPRRDFTPANETLLNNVRLEKRTKALIGLSEGNPKV